MPIAPSRRAWLKAGVFLALTAAFTYGLPWEHIPLPGGLMWGPGLAAIAVQLAFERRLSGLGWRLGGWRWLGLAIAIPLIYTAAVYLPGWLAGYSPLRPDAMAWIAGILNNDLGLPKMPDWALLPAFLAVLMTFALGVNLAAALGEEIGWRGLFVPLLASQLGWRGAALASGAIWAAWHYPGIFFGGYHADAPLWYGALNFSVMIAAMSVPMAWLTLRSRSLWPATVFHAAHNLFIQGAFGPLTVQDARHAWLSGEFGAVTAVACVLVAVFFWRKLPATSDAER